MASSPTKNAPTTPFKQRALSRLSMNSPSLVDIDCSPKTKDEMNKRKRKAEDLISEGSPGFTAPFLNWRLAVVNSRLDYLETQKAAISEAREFFGEAGKVREVYMAEIEADEDELQSEKKILLGQRKTLVEDMTDTLPKAGHHDPAYLKALEEAYIKELCMSLDTASSSKTKTPGLKAPRLARKEFANLVQDYLATFDGEEDVGGSLQWCNVMGHWLPTGVVKYAHIVPFSWDVKSTTHMFGSDEPALMSKRNGLSLQSKIEEAFDNSWLVIVPAESIDVTPTQWKVVLLNTAVKDDMFYNDRRFRNTGQDLWRWRDIDGKTLQFCNDNRPARRFLYMRYLLAWLRAERSRLAKFQEQSPSRRSLGNPRQA